MNWDQIEGRWQELKGVLREKWGKLTDSDVETIGGEMDQLVGALRRRYGMDREKAEREVADWLKTAEPGTRPERDEASQPHGPEHRTR